MIRYFCDRCDGWSEEKKYLSSCTLVVRVDGGHSLDTDIVVEKHFCNRCFRVMEVNMNSKLKNPK